MIILLRGMPISPRHDVCVIGAGLVGLAVARALSLEYDGISVLVLDKEERVAAHQSSHNSGVVHSGLYYRPGSLKAKLCVEGREAVYRLCEEENVPFRRSGKLVIATRERELESLAELERRGVANGLKGLRRLDPAGIREVEPEAVGLQALHVSEAGVADFPLLADRMAKRLMAAGTEIAISQEVTAIAQGSSRVTVDTEESSYSARMLVNCAGLHSDRVAAMAGVTSPVRIVPFRGEYYRLSESAADLVKGLVYPVPDPRFPFLGVHFTRRVDGTVEVGPNAVLAFGREHYSGTNRNWSDVREVFADRGFRRLAAKHLRAGAKELLSSRSTRLYARRARLLIPGIDRSDLQPGGSGVRAQAVASDGSLVDDFVIEQSESSVHVLNAPSPGATASLAIGRHIAAQIGPLFPR